MEISIGIFFRWLHILTACLAVDGLFFMRIVSRIGLRSHDELVRERGVWQSNIVRMQLPSSAPGGR